MKGAGGAFESAIQRSFPKDLYVRKLADPPARSPRCRRCQGTMETKCGRCHQHDNNSARFTSKNPFDFEVSKPLQVGSFNLAIECKSTDKPSLPANYVKDHQVKGLKEAVTGGWAAGLLIEYRANARRRETEVWWVPITGWVEHFEQPGAKKSLNSEIVASVAGAVRVQRSSRGRTRAYWEVGDLLEYLLSEARLAGDSGRVR